MLSFPHSSLIAEALASLDFLVVQDMFPTETARLANVILPAASFAEKEGTFTNTERRVQRVRRAIKPVGESKPDADMLNLIYQELKTLYAAEAGPLAEPVVPRHVERLQRDPGGRLRAAGGGLHRLGPAPAVAGRCWRSASPRSSSPKPHRRRHRYRWQAHPAKVH